MVTWETAQKCLWFAEGKKGKTLFHNVKTPDFPATLLTSGQEKDGDTGSAVAALLDGEEKLSMHQIGERLNISPQAVSLQVNRIKAKKEFYKEWKEFEKTLKSTGAAKVSIAKVLVSDKDKKAVSRLEAAGYVTVWDYLCAATTRSKREFYALMNTQQISVNRHFSELSNWLEPIINKGQDRKTGQIEGQLDMFGLTPGLPHREEK